MKEQPILGYDWEMGHEEIKLEIGTYYTGKGQFLLFQFSFFVRFIRFYVSFFI